MKFLRLGAALAITLATQFVLPVSAAPQEVYLGVFGEGEDYARDVYLLPNTIRSRGDLRRFQNRDVYHQQQDSAHGYKYRQSIGYWVTNCREGTIDVQKADYLDNQGRKAGDLSWNLELKVPTPGSINEKTLDLVCDYRK